MTPITYSVDIERPIQEVFDFVGNFENDKHWWKAVNTTKKLTPGPIAVGSEFDQLSKLMFITIHNHLCVIDYQPPTLIRYRNESSQLAYDLDYQFSTMGNNTTFTLVAELRPQGVLKWLLPLTMTTLYKQLKMYFGELKQYLEKMPNT